MVGEFWQQNDQAQALSGKKKAWKLKAPGVPAPCAGVKRDWQGRGQKEEEQHPKEVRPQRVPSSGLPVSSEEQDDTRGSGVPGSAAAGGQETPPGRDAAERMGHCADVPWAERFLCSGL